MARFKWQYKWRIGRKLGRTIYAMHGDSASDSDLFLGMMETTELAEYVVEIHNERLSNEQDDMK